VNFTDTSGGSPTSWAWNFGDPASGTSNTSSAQNPAHAFLSAGTYTVSLTATNAAGSNTATKAITASNGGSVPCVVSATQLCLNGGRFAVTAAWQKPDGSSGNGTGVGLTGDSGYFWFFDSANIEVVIKVLNGCAINGNHWVFAAGLTNVDVDLRVVDSETGAEYIQENPQGVAFAPIQDTKAFIASCPYRILNGGFHEGHAVRTITTVGPDPRGRRPLGFARRRHADGGRARRPRRPGRMQFVDEVSGTNVSTINAGDTVTWVWEGDMNHGVTAGVCPAGAVAVAATS
jgi:PKD repeat protein